MVNALPHAVGSLRTVRCRAMPREHSQSGCHWEISGLAYPSDSESEGLKAQELWVNPPQLIVIGELYLHSQMAGIAVTVEAMVRYLGETPARLTESDDEVLRQTEAVGGALQHMLYDTAASVARTLKGLTDLDIEVPFRTPEPKFSVWGTEVADSDEEVHNEELADR